ncbi:DUF6293 family protein [Methanoculleus sp. 10]|uniref:HFX_2341 family transcriptional regulator domain-containing protein n=1 Tax=Methanoculleus sp. 10 TaxID=430615 RepID=UPI001B6CED44|nr:DUF6293 family protein [Methanoculleus sp. 10]MBP7410678.1 hypothetical protein [Methanoculleus sp.]
MSMTNENDRVLPGGLRDVVHIIPLGHEIDRAVAPFTKNKADRAYILAVPPDAGLDAGMVKKQHYFVGRVTERLQELGIAVTFVPVAMFDILDVLRVVSCLIRTEKEAGNAVYVNMSSCGRKTSVAVTLAAMVHEAVLYYVSADRYATADGEECEHGLSIVEDARTEVFQHFRIMMPRPENVRLLVELFRRQEAGAGGMTSEEIIGFFHDASVHGYERLHTAERDAYLRAGKKRALLNRTNRGYLKELEEQGYVERRWQGRNFSIRITKAGEHIACVSGLIPGSGVGR